MVFDPKKEWLPVFPFPASPRHQKSGRYLGRISVRRSKRQPVITKETPRKSYEKNPGNKWNNQVPRSLGAKMCQPGCQVTRLTAEVLGEACLEAPAQQGLDVFVDFQEALGLVRELLLHLLEMVPGLEPQEPKELDGIVKDKKWGKNHAIKINVYTGPGFFFL
jgi:hypothetical protein